MCGETSSSIGTRDVRFRDESALLFVVLRTLLLGIGAGCESVVDLPLLHNVDPTKVGVDVEQCQPFLPALVVTFSRAAGR